MNKKIGITLVILCLCGIYSGCGKKDQLVCTTVTDNSKEKHIITFTKGKPSKMEAEWQVYGFDTNEMNQLYKQAQNAIGLLEEQVIGAKYQVEMKNSKIIQKATIDISKANGTFDTVFFDSNNTKKQVQSYYQENGYQCK